MAPLASADSLPAPARRYAVGLALRGTLDVDALLAALGQLGGRHPSLSPGVIEPGMIEPGFDAAGASGSIRDLSIGPLAVTLAVQEPNCHRLTLSTAALDPAGMGELAADLGHLYSSALLGEPAGPPPLSGPFPVGRLGPPIVQTRQEPGSRELPSSEAVEETGRLLPDHPPRKDPGEGHSSVVAPLGTRLASDLAAFVAAKGVSEYETCLAPLVLLLARFSGRSTVAVRVDPAEALVSRDRRLIGTRQALDTLRIRVDPMETGLSLVRAVQDAMELLIARACGEDGPESPAASPGTAAFRFKASLPPDCAEFLGLAARHDSAAAVGDDADLVLSIVEASDTPCIEWGFDASRFDAQTIGHWIDSYRALLGSLVTEGESPAALLEMVGAGQLERLQAWNAAQRAPEEAPLLPARFAACVQRAPDATALWTPDIVASYREVDAASNRLAHELRARGVARHARVAIVLDPGVDDVIAHLAVFKCGAVAVPLDPGWPAATRDALLASTQPAYVISTAAIAGEPASMPVPSLLLDEASDSIRRQPPSAEPPWPLPDPDDAACVLFDAIPSCASHGIPVSHRALAARVAAVCDRPELAANDKVAVIGGTEDAACPIEVLGALCQGAAAFFGERSPAAAPFEWKERLDSGGITWMRAPAAAWRALLACGWRPGPGFRALVPTEELDRGLAKRLLDAGVQAWHVQALGGAVGWLASARLREHDAGADAGGAWSAPAARLCEGVAAWVLDDHGEVCPVGVAGELHVGGVAVSQGYLDHGAESAARFVPDLLGPRSGCRLYRTGRRARWRHDGRLALFPVRAPAGDEAEESVDMIGAGPAAADPAASILVPAIPGSATSVPATPIPAAPIPVIPIPVTGRAAPEVPAVLPDIFAPAGMAAPAADRHPAPPSGHRDRRLAYLAVTLAGVLTGFAVMWGVDHWYHGDAPRNGMPVDAAPAARAPGTAACADATPIDGRCGEAAR